MAELIDVRAPDLGDFHDIPVIEVHIAPGSTLALESPLVTLESDKATMDIPSPVAGRVREVLVKLGDKINEGSLLARVEREEGGATTLPEPAAPAADVPPSQAAIESTEEPAPASPAPPDSSVVPAEPPVTEASTRQPGGLPHASPSVRRFARQLGADLARIRGSGPSGRITQADVEAHVKAILTGQENVDGVSGLVLSLPPWPTQDPARFGPVSRQPLSRIRKISGPALARNWVMIPAVTYHDDADVTELDAFRRTLNDEATESRITLLAFLIKAVTCALRAFPDFNSSLDGDELVLKHYYHIGFAADTPQGLVVPVIRDADTKSVRELARETAELAARARAGKLAPSDIGGASFSISSLGGIGGGYFSPIVNAPEVAILGVGRTAVKPVWNGQTFVPRTLLPLSLSADHRVIDGALAARFHGHLVELLEDFRRVTL